jgi:succinate---hydroxymethylglutarate CoA-transferase
VRRILEDGEQHIVRKTFILPLGLLTQSASIVPYRGFKTLDGDILLGGGNDRLFGVLCEKLEKPEWSQDSRFVTNNLRVKNRAELENMIEAITKKKTTKEWLDILEGSGMPYAAINDVQSTLNHEHSKCERVITFDSSN